MTYTCRHCKYGQERSPDGQRPPSGTVWCGKRKMPMGQGRNLSCFAPPAAEKGRRCQDCRWARILKPSGETPETGNVWCTRRHFEINRLRAMECFE